MLDDFETEKGTCIIFVSVRHAIRVWETRPFVVRLAGRIYARWYLHLPSRKERCIPSQSRLVWDRSSLVIARHATKTEALGVVLHPAGRAKRRQPLANIHHMLWKIKL